MPIHKHTFKHGPIPHYEVCTICETLHRISDVAPSSVYADGYWSREGHSNIHEQVYNVSQFKNEAGVTKIGSVLKYIPDECGEALEIACAPGAAMASLWGYCKGVTGIEFSDQYKDEIMKYSGDSRTKLAFGSFPEVTKDWDEDYFSLIIALDFFEHAANGQAVIEEVRGLLTDGGVAVFMSPFLFNDGQYREQDRHEEHIWLYSQNYLKEWMESMFSEVKFDRWIVGHELLIVKK